MARQKSEVRRVLKESFIVTYHKTTRKFRFPRKKAEQSTTEEAEQKRTNREKRIFSNFKRFEIARKYRAHARARTRIRWHARAHARARALGRLSNCFGRGLTSSTSEQQIYFLEKYQNIKRKRRWRNTPF